MAKLGDYLIYACEQLYGGLHGMYDFCVQYGITLEEANEYGYHMSIGVMESYSCIMDDLQADVEAYLERDTIDDNEWEETVTKALGEAEVENTEWAIYRLRSNLTAEDKQKIKSLDWEEIRDYYCEKE